jgi:hypothetical protein
MHPVQLALNPQPGLVETDDLAGGQPVAHPVQELSQPPRGAAGDVCDRARGDRGAEQLGQRVGGPLLGQELPNIQVQVDRGDPRGLGHYELAVDEPIQLRVASAFAELAEAI